MEERCQKINVFIFGILFPWNSTFGAARSDEKPLVVHKDRRAAMLQKGRETLADSEFCERQRKAFATKETDYFSLGVICRTKGSTSTAALPPVGQRVKSNNYQAIALLKYDTFLTFYSLL